MSHLTPKAEELVRAGRAALRPSAAERERVLQALLPQVGGSLGAEGASGLSSAPAAANATLVKVLTVVVGSGVAGGGLVLALRSEPPPARAPAEPPPAAMSARPLPAAAPAEPPPAVAPVHSGSAAPAVQNAQSPRSPSLSRPLRTAWRRKTRSSRALAPTCTPGDRRLRWRRSPNTSGSFPAAC